MSTASIPVVYDDVLEQVEINGRRYSLVLFGPEGFGARPGTVIEIISDRADVVTVRRFPMLEAVIAELRRATEKFPTWPNDPLHAVAILGEEFGELTKAMLQMTYEPHKVDLQDIEGEAIQTAAMALRLVMSLQRYRYARSEQHSQAEI